MFNYLMSCSLLLIMVSYFIDFAKTILGYIGLYNPIRYYFMCIGLEGSGKTTLIHMLKSNTIIKAKQTFNPTCDDFKLNDKNIRLFDLPGRKYFRTVIPDYYELSDGIIYFVDISNYLIFDEARNQLKDILENPLLKNKPILVLGNKADEDRAVSEDTLIKALSLEFIKIKDTNIKLFLCSGIKQTGYQEAFKWLLDYNNKQ